MSNQLLIAVASRKQQWSYTDLTPSAPLHLPAQIIVLDELPESCLDRHNLTHVHLIRVLRSEIPLSKGCIFSVAHRKLNVKVSLMWKL